MTKQNIFPASGIVLVCIAIFSAGCTKTGAAGATGPQGNANVRVDTFSLSSAQWLYNDNYILYTGQGSYTEWFTRYYKASIPQVTQGILDSGMVLVYMTPNTADPNQWSPLPFTYETGLGYSFDFVYVTAPGSVELEFYFGETNSSTTPPTLSTYTLDTYKFKIVAVTGTISTSMKAQIDTRNYASVAKYLGL
jgi:hypothetical protein